MKSHDSFVLLIFAICIGLSSQTHAVSPPPDGGYPGGNTAEGQAALLNLSTGGFNTAVGFASLRSNTITSFNTAIGAGTLLANVANNNTAIGVGALLSNTTGSANTASGVHSLINNIAGEGNTATGGNALQANTIGNLNTANGFSALSNCTTGNNNTALGVGAGDSITTANNVIAIGAPGADVDDSCYIGHIWNQPGGSQAVYVNASGKLGAQVSSRRFKDEIKPMEEASKVIYRLKPVSFRYKPEIEPTRPIGFGLIAEDVEKVNRDLVVFDKEGQPYSVRYDQVNAMLLNEFLKEHKIVQELQATVQKQDAIIAQQQKSFQSEFAAQKKRLETVTAELGKLSAQLELSKSRSQTALNNP
jgi:hypothetical protein